MSELSEKQLHAVRLEIAVRICLEHPTLYRKIYGKVKWKIYDYESTAADVLSGICATDKLIRAILDCYYKV